MSDYTPITTKLRARGRYYDGVLPNDDRHVAYDVTEFEFMCDAIDAVHAELEQENERLRRELDERPIAVGPDALEAMARLEHSVELPKDADNETICANDDVEWLEGTKHGRVTGIGVGEYYGWVWVLMEGRNVSIALTASDLHHVKSDTWERIIEDALDGYHDTDFDALVARCKALCERTKGGDAE